ncbi:MAG: hypothetical protein IJJ33_18620 [Victivallales bacterium]|nr:hypothetical protein [Victivallales bacterium]
MPVEYRPLPTYSGWTKERMERDLQRLQENRLNGAVLRLSPQDIADSFKRARLKEFLDISLKHDCTALLCLTAEHPMQLDLGNTERFLKYQGIADHAALYRKGQNVILAFAEGIQLTGRDEAGFEHRLLGRDWTALPCSSESLNLSAKDDLIWIYTSFHKPSKASWPIQEWMLPRSGFKHFRKTLEKARESSPKIIVISSWNDFYNGSALEKNTLDGEKGLEILRKQLEKWK